MTRKHFNSIAISIGWRMRDYERESREWEAILDTAATIAADLRAMNSRFDTDRFLGLILDVADEGRDLEGRKVAS